MKKYILLILFLASINITRASTDANQTIQANIADVMHIDKVIINNVEHEKDEYLGKVNIRTAKKINDECYKIDLDPFIVRINTNMNDPIQVSAEFTRCISDCGRYPIDNSDLSITPKSHTINNPHNLIETDFFTPSVLVHKDTVLTTYNARLTITLSRI